MRIVAGGQNRFQGWHHLLFKELASIRWKSPGTAATTLTIIYKNITMRLNGSYTVKLTLTNEDCKAIAPQLLTDRDKIELAKSALTNLPRNEVIDLLGLSDDEKIALAREMLHHLPFGEVISRLHVRPNEDAA